jgi:hypothetical protein
MIQVIKQGTGTVIIRPGKRRKYDIDLAEKVQKIIEIIISI